jgi:hypothetical protein
MLPADRMALVCSSAELSLPYVYVEFSNLLSESVMWLAFVGKLVNPFA